ncbi:hypothetical protein HG536_0F02560 [Torulaspora globosa]|uniref:PH-response regulator protein palI/RIM9 n=1 Tax=Torulaspora globosa TaxID=48254 RepID=A0A7G3ZK95_9SACH|nr:uncharacterized protein HG536_0F02560 [Torulaspora globosa]QLL33931.1 hypothetical protein HG536_0F02560 [Torulaspora globosa]
MLPRTRAVFTVICGFQFAAMAFLVIACITAPVFKQIGLSKYQGTTYGVFGYCQSDKGCSKAAATYDPFEVGSGSNGDWTLGTTPRKRLGKILIVTPVAAGLNFISLVSTLLAFAIGLLRDSTSGILFTLNLAMTALAFAASALVCVVTFLLFYPHVTWCSWLLIPAAVLPLIAIPLVFVAHSSGRRAGHGESDDDLTGIVQHDAILDSEFDSPSRKNGSYRELNNTSDSLLEKPLILPSYDNLHKQESVVRTDTDTTAHSTVEKDPYEIQAETKSQTAFSAINGPSGQVRPPVSLSMASSEYSNNYPQSQLQKEPRDVLEDIIKDSLSKDELAESHVRSVSDNGSDFTSISQRAARQQPAGPRPFPSQQQNMPPNVRSAGPDPTEMLLQNNPNFLHPNTRRMQPPVHNQQPNHFPQHPHRPRHPNSYGGFQNSVPTPVAPSTSTHYKPAYKRVGARNNMMPPASSMNGNNPYQFR